VSELNTHYDRRLETALAAVKLTMGVWIAVIAGGLIGLSMLAQGAVFMGVIVTAAAGAVFFWKHKDLERIRNETKAAMLAERDTAIQMARACLAELADLRREIAVEDTKSALVSDFLEQLRATQFVLQRPEQSRAALA
jgi:hypothetical protein